MSRAESFNRRLTKMEVEATGKRYCTNCQSKQSPEGGEKRSSRWICAGCVYRRKNKIETWKK